MSRFVCASVLSPLPILIWRFCPGPVPGGVPADVPRFETYRSLRTFHTYSNDEPIDLVYCFAGEVQEGCFPFFDVLGWTHVHSLGCDGGELRYSLRSVAKYAPWVHKVYILVNGPPKQLSFVKSNTTGWRGSLEIVDRCALFDRKDDCPTFNTHACRIVAHRTPGVSRRYLMMDDDFIFTNPVTPDIFFNKGVPRLFVKIAGLREKNWVYRPIGWPVMRVPGRLWKGEPDLFDDYKGTHHPMPLDRDFLHDFEQDYREWFSMVCSHKARVMCPPEAFYTGAGCDSFGYHVEGIEPVLAYVMQKSGAAEFPTFDFDSHYVELGYPVGHPFRDNALAKLEGLMRSNTSKFAAIQHAGEFGAVAEMRRILDTKLGVPAPFEIAP